MARATLPLILLTLLNLMHEIGSFLEYKKEFFNAKNNKFSNLVFFKSGRESLRYLVGYFKVKTLFLPSYFCNEAEDYLKKISNLKIKKYALDGKFAVKINSLTAIKNNKEAAVLLVDFFGRRDQNYSQIVGLLRKKGIIIISDRTHSVLNTYRDYCDAEFTSVRKLFVNLPGAYIGRIKYRGDFSKIDLRPSIRMLELKNKYLKNHDNELKNRFLKYMKVEEDGFADFQKNIQAVKLPPLKEMLYRADFSKMRKARKENYEALRKDLRSNKYFGWFNLGYAQNETPAFALVKCCDYKTREKLKRRLIKNNIYPPIHWPNGTKLSRLLLSIPIDHRYSPEDMRHIGLVINNFKS